MKMNLKHLHRTVWLGLFILGAPTLMAEDAIYADFTTSMGNFSCKLSYTLAPMTTANFIGLATGQQPWLDLTTGQVRTNPFYNGLTFHRVLNRKLIQAGSPNGQGTDGPGYVIKDENTTITHAAVKYALAMAKMSWVPDVYHRDGAVLPNTANSQFYITVTNMPQFDPTFVVFGGVSSGSTVVEAISRVATTNDKPLTPVIISNITIRRVGAGTNFNINAQPLPWASQEPLQASFQRGQSGQPGQLTLTYNNQLYAHNRLYDTTSLWQWSYRDLEINLATPLTTSYRVSTTNDQEYFGLSLSRVLYPSSTWAPYWLTNKTLRMKYYYSDGTNVYTVTNVMSFNATGGGTMSISDKYGTLPGTIAGYYWYQDIYRGYLWPVSYTYDGLDTAITLWLDFTSPTGGVVNGTVYVLYNVAPWYPFAGSFTLTP